MYVSLAIFNQDSKSCIIILSYSRVSNKSAGQNKHVGGKNLQILSIFRNLNLFMRDLSYFLVLIIFKMDNLSIIQSNDYEISSKT